MKKFIIFAAILLTLYGGFIGYHFESIKDFLFPPDKKEFNNSPVSGLDSVIYIDSKNLSKDENENIEELNTVHIDYLNSIAIGRQTDSYDNRHVIGKYVK